MSDVEQLTHNNQERRRWAEEVEQSYRAEIATVAAPLRNDRQERKEGLLWTAHTFCAMACGMCGTFLAIGLAEAHLPTVIISALCAGVFLMTGVQIENRLKYRKTGG